MGLILLLCLLFIGAIPVPALGFINVEDQIGQSEVTPQYISDRITQSKEYLPNEPDSALRIVEELLIRQEIEQDDSLFTTVKYLEGVAYYYKDYYNLAIESYEQALATDFAQSDLAFQVRIYNNLGVCYDNLKQHDEALRYYHEALEVEKERGDPAEMADMYINIGLVYHSIEEYEEALENFKMAQQLVEGLSVGYTRGLIQQNLGIVYRSMGNLEQSRIATQKAIEIFDEFDLHRGILQSKYNQAINYIDIEEYEQARAIIEEAIEESITYEIPVQRALLTIQLGRIELQNERPASAITYFNSAEAIISEFNEGYSSFPIELYKSKLEAYAQMGNANGVLNTFQEYEKIREERDLARQTTAINELELQLEVSENRAKMQEQTIELQQERAKNKTFIYLTTILVVLLAGSLLFMKYRNDKLKKLYEVNQRVVKQHKRFHLFAGREQEGKPGKVSERSEEADQQEPGKAEIETKEEEAAIEKQEDEPEEQKKPDRAERWIYKKVNDLVDEKSLHKNPNLTLSDLSAEAGVSSRAVSESINYYSGISFNHFINEFRVVDAMKLLEDESQNHLSLEAIMEDCGFASRSTFYSAFDKVSGMTPNQYRKISQKEQKINS